MPFPKTRKDFIAAGYKWERDGVCSGCGASIRFYRTPKGSLMPMNPMRTDESEPISHFANCPKAADFRKRK